MSSSEEEEGGGRIRFTTEGDYEDGCVESCGVVWCVLMGNVGVWGVMDVIIGLSSLGCDGMYVCV